jgi:hypothetical protein
MENRRSSARWEVGMWAKVKLKENEIPVDCHVKDISFKGLKLMMPLKVESDTHIGLTIILSEEFHFTVEAWVTWHHVMEEHNYYGIYFTKIRDADKEKIFRFIQRYLPEQLRQEWWKGINQEKGGEDMQTTSFEDKRIFQRYALELPLRYLEVDSDKEGEGLTYDKSAKGIGMVTDKQLAPLKVLEIWLKVPDKGEPLYARGEVVWSKALADNRYRSGINLEKANLMGISRILRAEK